MYTHPIAFVETTPMVIFSLWTKRIPISKYNIDSTSHLFPNALKISSYKPMFSNKNLVPIKMMKYDNYIKCETLTPKI